MRRVLKLAGQCLLWLIGTAFAAFVLWGVLFYDDTAEQVRNHRAGEVRDKRPPDELLIRGCWPDSFECATVWIDSVEPDDWSRMQVGSWYDKNS